MFVLNQSIICLMFVCFHKCKVMIFFDNIVFISMLAKIDR